MNRSIYFLIFLALVLGCEQPNIADNTNPEPNQGIGLYDYGDAPEPSYPITHSQNGARHKNDSGNIYLGTCVDGELDGQPGISASGDDSSEYDDDDGVVHDGPLNAGTTESLSVTASDAGYMNGWIDFNSDGDWDDNGEQIFSDIALSPGVQTLSFPIPASAVTGDTYMRIRFSSATSLTVTGEAPDGEVEDYLITIE